MYTCVTLLCYHQDHQYKTYSQLLSKTGVNRKAGADPRNSKLGQENLPLNIWKSKQQPWGYIHTLIWKAEEGTGEGGGRKGGVGGGGDSLNSQCKVPQGLSIRPIWLCHAFRISNAMIISILYIYKILTISYYNCLIAYTCFLWSNLLWREHCCRRIRLRSTEWKVRSSTST